MNERTARQLLGWGLPAMALGLTVVPYLAVRSDLPERVATHFDGSGTPDGSMSPVALLLMTLVMAGAGVAVCSWLAWSHREHQSFIAPTAGFLGGFFAGLGAGISAVTFVSQRGLEDWRDAGSLWALIVLPLVLAVAGGSIAARLATYLPVAQVQVAPQDQPVLDLADRQHAVWVDTLHSKWLFRSGVVMFCIGVVFVFLAWWVLAFGATLIGLVTVSLATLRVRADRNGLHVKYGMLPWPSTTIAIDQMSTASMIDVRPMEWGGWGYRGSLKLMKRAAVVHRAGPGIRLDLRNGKVFVVTIDNPETAVALLNAEIGRVAPVST